MKPIEKQFVLRNPPITKRVLSEEEKKQKPKRVYRGELFDEYEYPELNG